MWETLIFWKKITWNKVFIGILSFSIKYQPFKFAHNSTTFILLTHIPITHIQMRQVCILSKLKRWQFRYRLCARIGSHSAVKLVEKMEYPEMNENQISFELIHSWSRTQVRVQGVPLMTIERRTCCSFRHVCCCHCFYRSRTMCVIDTESRTYPTPLYCTVQPPIGNRN